MINIWRPLRLSSLLAAAVMLLILYSCSDHDIKRKPPAAPPAPDAEPNSDPENKTGANEGDLPLCAPDLVYGYCDKPSYAPGEKINVYLQAKRDVGLCRLAVYNLKGDSVFSVASPLSVQQIGSNPSVQGYGFSVTVEFTLPSALESGIYLIEKTIPFIIKPQRSVELLVVYPSNTANAYSQSGGKSLYSPDRPHEVSFHRPIGLQSLSVVCLHWLASLSEYSIGYIADIDLDFYENINGSKILCIVGHNEYWTRTARENFDKFVNQGGHALILSGNTMWWQVRYSEDKTKLICYKSKDMDPISNPSLKTYLWNDPSLAYPIISSIGADFDLGGYGLRTDTGWDGFKISNPSSPLLEGLSLNKGDLIHCPSLEYDGAPIRHWDVDGYPVLDKEAMKADKVELIGFDRGFRGNETFGTFFVMQKSAVAGIIINTGTTDWCSYNGMGGASGSAIKTITKNAIHKLLTNQPIFTQ